MKFTSAFFAGLIILLCVPLALCAAEAGEELVREILGDSDPRLSRDPAAMVTVRDIRYVLPESVDRAWVESLIDVKQGARLSVAGLDRLIARSRRKLEATRQFGGVNVYALPPVKDPRERTVVVEASAGFWFGFYCWPWDVGVSFNHLFRADKAVSLTLGLDTQEVIYYDPALGYSPFYLLLDLYNVIAPYEGKYLDDTLGAVLRFGVNLTENVALYADSAIACHFFPDSYFLFPGIAADLSDAEREALGIARPRVLLRESLGLALNFFRPYDDNRVGLKGYVSGSLFIALDDPATSYFSINSDLKLLFVPADWLILMLRNTAGVHPVRTYGYQRYDVGSMYRGVPRVSPVDVVDVVRAEASLRNLPPLSLLGVRILDILPFVFADFLRAWESPDGIDWADVWGGVETCLGGGVYLHLRTLFNMYVTLGASVSPANGDAFRFFYKFSLDLY
ncbi:MAG: hypothetical protein JXD23_00820 [Spirochaetales bacterium]|nr:hypothetical protein [Spirochaetales bacterium]